MLIWRKHHERLCPRGDPLLPLRPQLHPLLHASGRVLSRLRRRGGQPELHHRQVLPGPRRGAFCWECPEYPCSHYDGFDDGDSFVPHRNRQQDIARAQELGLEVYLAQLEEKRAILDALLAGYNDGRRKTFFHTAVYLLPLEDLQSVMADLDSRPELAGQPIKERALVAVELLQQAADRRGISLKLNKKAKKG